MCLAEDVGLFQHVMWCQFVQHETRYESCQHQILFVRSFVICSKIFWLLSIWITCYLLSFDTKCAQMDQQPTRNFLHGRNEQMDRTIEKMCKREWWLCWKIRVYCVRDIDFFHSDVTVIVLKCRKPFYTIGNRTYQSLLLRFRSRNDSLS